MNTAQRLFHERMLRTYPVKTHWKLFPEAMYRMNALTGKVASANGRKGRIASKMDTPVRLKGSWDIPVLVKKRKR